MEPILSVNNVSKKIQGKIILDNINFSVKQGEILGIKGRNASGKSMLFKALTGLLVLDEGEIKVFGKSIEEEGTLTEVGALIEYPGFLPNISGYKNLSLLASIRNIISSDKIIDVMKKFNLDPYDNLPFKKYSLGNRQKLGIAAAIMEDPKILYLDEPCNNLDIENVQMVRELLQNINIEKKTTILIASHNIEDLDKLCTAMCEIKNGRLETIQ